MTIQRRLVLGLVCALAALQVGSGARTQELPQGALLRADGTVWQWSAASADLQPVRGLTDVAAAGLLGDEILTARVDGSTWLSRLDDGSGEPLADAPRLHSIACGRGTCAAVTSTDHVVLWRGGTELIPVEGIDDVAAVSLGDRHGLALTHTGVVWAWGFNDRGQLGTDAVRETDRPVLVPGLADVVSIAAGADVSAATLRDGFVWAWGANDAGQLGLADSGDVRAPWSVPGLRSAVQVAAGGPGVFVLFQDGTAVPLSAARGGADAVRISGEIVALRPVGSTVLAERADEAYWDLAGNRALDADGRETTTTEEGAPAEDQSADGEPAAGTEPAGGAGRAVLLTGKAERTVADAFIAARLSALGFAVDVVRQPHSTRELAGAALVVVSPSIQADSFDAKALAGLSVPLIVGERFLFEPLGMTRRDQLPTHGSESGRVLSIVRPGHPLAAGFTARPHLLSARGSIAFGRPAPGATVVATTTMGGPAIFAFEKGAATANGPAVARRVAFPLASYKLSMAPESEQLFDAAVRWASSTEPEPEEPEAVAATGSVLLVVGSDQPQLAPGDAVYKARIERLGFTVQVKTSSAVTGNDALSPLRAMVFISHTSPNTEIGTKFTTVAVPVAIQNAGGLVNMNMASSVDQCKVGTVVTPSNQTTVITSTHQITSGLTGTQQVSGTVGTQQMGVSLGSEAVSVLGCASGTAGATTFTYAQGAQMVGPTALARRTMWGFFAPIPTTFNNTGKDLFDRMILWTSNSGDQPPFVDAGPDQAATTCETPPVCTPITLNGHVTHDGLPTASLASLGWEFVSGTGTVTFTNQTSEVAQATFDNTGTYVLKLKAKDSGGQEGSDTVTIQVYGQTSNQPPSVNAGPDQFVETPNGTTLTGIVTDEGLPNPPGMVFYQWTKVSGPAATINAPTSSLTGVTLPVQGTYVFRLTARDDVAPNGLSAYDDVVITSAKAVLLVVGNATAPLPPSDAALKKRFEDLGFPVLVKDDNAVQPNPDAINKAFIWLSSTVDPNFAGSGGTTFKTTAIPLAVQVTGYADNLGLTDGVNGTGTGNAFNQSQVTITAPTSALSAGLVNTVTASTVGQYDWGVPAAPGAPPAQPPIAVARLTTSPPLRHVVFAYPQGAQLYSGNAQDKRLFFGFQGGPMTGTTAEGRKLLDAAIYWLSGKNSPPWVDAGPSRVAALNPTSATVSLNGYVVDDDQLAAPPIFTWTASGPGAVSFGNAAQMVTNATFTVPGDYILRLTARDGDLALGGKSSSDVTFVSIFPAGTNGKPSVAAGPDRTIRLPQKANLLALASDDGLPNPPGLLGYTWTQVNGPTGATITPSNQAGTLVTFTQPGVYLFRVTVTDNPGILTNGVAFDDVQVTVEPTRSALFIVGSMDASDTRVAAELEGLGFTPVIRAPGGYTGAEVTAASLILVSSTISSTTLNNAFQNTPKPVLIWEPELFDDMGMTAASASGVTLETHTSLLIASPAHPLAAALSGTQTVYSPAATVEWGTPGPQAVKVATLTTNGSQAPVFAYESGSAMSSGVAPARRVGFFGSAASWTPSGTALFRAAVQWATQPTVDTLFVASVVPLNASDQALKERIHALGYSVTTVAGSSATLAHSTNKAFVVISNGTGVANTFRNAVTAVVTWDGAVMSSMEMVGTTSGTNYGTAANQTKVSILDRYHPLAAGLASVVTTTPALATYTWGVPGSSAARVASLEQDASKLTVFGYEPLTILASGPANRPAPDRRAGLFLPSPATLTDQGKALFDAAIRWAASSDPDSDGLGTADEYRYGTNPRVADSNDDGILDGPSVHGGINPTNTDVDSDGLTNAVERGQGTNPFNRDTDGDGYTDALAGFAVDCFPLDPTRHLCPTSSNQAPPVITLTEPTNATPFP